MNDKDTQNPLVFTLFEDEVRLPEAQNQASHVEDDIEDWESALLRVREQRRDQAPVVIQSENPSQVFESKETGSGEAAAVETVDMAHILNSARRRKLDAETQKQVQQAYIQHWQQQHNQQKHVLEDAPADVIFAEDWQKQQGKGVMGRQDVLVEQATVWVNRNRQARLLEGQSILAKLLAREQQEAGASETVTEVAKAHETVQRLPEDDVALAEKVVLLNVYQPNARTQNPLICLGEEDLLLRLSEKLRPHLSDAVAGMVKTVVQRKQALMLQDLQQALMESVPQLVDDVLNHNLARAVAAIKKEQQAVGRDVES